MCFTIFLNEKTAFQAIKTTSSKCRKIDIFQRVEPMLLVQKWPFFKFSIFQVIQAIKMSFTIIQSEKTPFQNIKTRSLKSRKIDIFPKGLTHAFGPKVAIFQIFYFQVIQARKMSVTIFQNEKTAFQATKTRSSKSLKMDIFPKGLTHALVQKWPFFQLFLFRQYKPGKCLLRYSRRVKRLSRP